MSNPPAYRLEAQTPRPLIDSALAGARPQSYWLDSSERPAARPAHAGEVTTDLVVVGGGYTGLWTALIAKERDPDRRVVLLEATRIGDAASGRNGGFVAASLTHGDENGQRRFAGELVVLQRLAEQNFADFAETLRRYDLDAEWEETGKLVVATEPYQVEGMREAVRHLGDPTVQVLVDDELRAVGNSPLYRAGYFRRAGYAFVNPAKLVWGLAQAAERLGVEIFENSPVTRMRPVGTSAMRLETTGGTVLAQRVALATNAFPSLLRRLRLFTVPVYDYAIMTEPLTDEQLASIGWTERYGITDSSRQFHYYRKSADNRILFGGYDAIYHRGRRVSEAHDQRPESFRRLVDHLLLTFPALGGVRITHTWGGAIDMSTQLVAFHRRALGGRVAASAGYTGLGVAATRFGAETMLDMLEGRDTDRTRLSMARRLPIPIPPEPLAYPLIETMRRAVVRSDLNGGRDGMLLRLASRFGVDFDS